MDLKATRSFLIEWLKQLQDQTLLAELEVIAKSQSEGDWWEELPDTVKESIQKGNQDFELTKPNRFSKLFRAETARCGVAIANSNAFGSAFLLYNRR